MQHSHEIFQQTCLMDQDDRELRKFSPIVKLILEGNNLNNSTNNSFTKQIKTSFRKKEERGTRSTKMGLKIHFQFGKDSCLKAIYDYLADLRNFRLRKLVGLQIPEDTLERWE